MILPPSIMILPPLAVLTIHVVSFFAGALITLILLHMLVPLIVRTLNERAFVDMGGLEPCSIVLFAGFVGATYPILATRFGYGWALCLFPAVGVLCVIYAILWLKLAGAGQRKKEFAIHDGQIIRLADGKRLAPAYVQQDVAFNQTDAFHSYGFYGLTLHDENGPMARNGYLNEEEAQQALRDILQVTREMPCRALDIIFIRRESDVLWWEVRLDQEWAPLLCGPLAEVSPESRAWWRRWLRPEFPEDGLAEVPPEELEKHLNELKRAYSSLMIPPEDVPKVPPEELERQMAALDRKKEWKQLVELSKEYGKARRNDWMRLEMLLRRTEQPIQIMTSKRHEIEVRQVAPQGATLCYGEANGHESALAMKIEPR